MIRILIVDDHPVVRHGISAILRYEPGMEVVGLAEDGMKAVELIRSEQPDIVLLDLHLPLLSGIEVMKQIRAENQQIRFLVLTTYDTDAYILPALAAGAQGYLLKDATPEDLTRAIHSLVRGGAALEPSVAARLLGHTYENDSAEELSAREHEVLELLVQGKSNRDIALHLGVSENTVKTHMSRVLSKLGARSRAEAIAVALQRKLVPPPA